MDLKNVKILDGKAAIELSSKELDEAIQKASDQLNVFQNRVARLEVELAALNLAKNSL